MTFFRVYFIYLDESASFIFVRDDSSDNYKHMSILIFVKTMVQYQLRTWYIITILIKFKVFEKTVDARYKLNFKIYHNIPNQ